ncbi:MAG: hypothetical protein CMB38_03825 [Euryarchaeota archaeon]|nr:hypothetical protein [Euryarchaeota archaeon]|tara:strand:- start:779 stop:1174 length:396 start_codon:yes stop_codon:yes gene_type:complete
MDQLKKILNPKIWLLVVAVGHTLATILPVLSEKGLNLDETEVEYAVWRVVSMIIPMVFIALTFTKEIQAKMATVIAGPVWVMFVIWIVMDGFQTQFIPPVVLWGLLALSGVLHGNWQTDEVALEATVGSEG